MFLRGIVDNPSSLIKCMGDFSVPPSLLLPLARLYEWEASEVSMNGMVGSRFDVSWNRADLREIVQDGEVADALFNFMLERHRLCPLANNKYRTDTCELVRLSTFNYNRFAQTRLEPTQVGVTWRVERKHAPMWEMTVGDVRNALQQEFHEGWTDSHGLHSYADADGLVEASSIVLEAFDNMRSGEGSLSGFQFRSLRDMLRGAKSTGFKTQAIVAGTGLGKSYGFQLGVMISLVHARMIEGDYQPRTVHSMFLYPRVALVLDQRNGIVRLIEAINAVLSTRGHREIRHVTDAKSMLKIDEYIRWFPNTSSHDLKNMSIKKAISAIYGRQDGPDIVIGNPDSLRNRMWNPESAYALQTDLRHVVYDEVHLLESITGANGASFLRRLAGISNPGNDVMLTGASATVAEEKEHVGAVFGRNPSEVVVSTPNSDDQWELSGLIHHVFHRSREGQNFQGNVANLSSTVLHGRRRMDEVSSGDAQASALQKSIGFADSLQFLGSWNYLLRDLEGLTLTKSQKSAIRNNNPNLPNLLHGQNPHPLRFNRPLVNLCKAHPFAEASIEEVEEHCQSCIEGKKSDLPIPLDDRFGEIVLDIRNNGNFTMRQTIWESQEQTSPSISTTDGCPFFTMGLCWREQAPATPVEAWDQGPVMTHNPMTPLLLTGSTLRTLTERGGAQKPDEYFLMQPSETIGIVNRQTSQHINNLAEVRHARVALSSPAMEVGVDLDNLTEAILFKAIRNIASYRQKIGRLGRERYRDTYAATLASFRAIDFHYYRNPTPLLSNNNLEPIPLATQNLDLKRQLAFHAIMDWFSRQHTMVRNLDSDQSHDALVDGIEVLVRHRSNLTSHLIDRIGVNAEDADDAINAMTDLLNLFVEDHSCLMTGGPSFSRYLGRPPRRIKLTTAGASFTQIVDRVISVLQDVCHHTTRLREIDAPLAREMTILNQSWKLISEGRAAPQLWAYVQRFNTDEGRNLFISAMMEFGNGDPAVIALMEMNRFCADLENCMINYPELTQYIDDGRFAVGRSILDWNEMWAERDNMKKWWYFRNVCANLFMTMHNRPWIFPPTLFEPPAEMKVDIFFPGTHGDEGKNEIINLREALFAYLPGMWNYRYDGRPLKSKCYKGLIELEEHGVLALPLATKDDNVAHRFIHDNAVPSTARPWGTPLLNPVQTEIQVMRPVKLNLMMSKGLQNGNRVFLTDTPGIVADEDDTPRGRQDLELDDGEDPPTSNMPECTAIQWREIMENTPFSVHSYGRARFGMEFSSNEIVRGMFSEIKYDTSCNANEYVFGHVRRMTGRPPSTVYYLDNSRHQSSVVLGQSFKTNGLQFCFDASHLQSVLQGTWERLNDPDAGSSDRLQAVTHVLMEAASLSLFQAEHLLRIGLQVSEPTSLDDWFNCINGISPPEIDAHEQNWQNRTGRPAGLETRKTALCNALNALTLGEFNTLIDLWVIRTYANSVGISLLQAGRSLSGCRDQDLGYHIDVPIDEIRNGLANVKIWLYDRATDGNGTSETINKWFHIPTVVREIARDNPGLLPTLPTRDFIDHWMMFMRPCHAHQAERASHLVTINNISVEEEDLPRRLREDFRFSIEQYHDTWISLQQQNYFSLREAFLLSELTHDDDVMTEQVKKSSRVCGTSCPQCLDEFGISALGPLVGPVYANKRVMELGVKMIMLDHPDVYRLEDVSLEGVINALTNMGQLTTNVQAINVEDAHGHQHAYRPMRQPTHLWEEVDFEALQMANPTLGSKMYVRMDSEGWD